MISFKVRLLLSSRKLTSLSTLLFELKSLKDLYLPTKLTNREASRYIWTESTRSLPDSKRAATVYSRPFGICFLGLAVCFFAPVFFPLPGGGMELPSSVKTIYGYIVCMSADIGEWHLSSVYTVNSVFEYEYTVR
ncbi:hypothetical protein D3C75_1142430 [compost metagenome]